jgi:Skp family chaperone for outer membrane proteins
MQQWDPKTQRFSTSPDALVATLVDGRDADLVTLGNLAEAIIPAVNKEIVAMEREVEAKRAKIQEKEQQLSVIESKLPGRS